jgi:hypothetical protein
MTQPFAPQDHLIKIPRRVKNANGAWETVHDDYLEVKFRLVMFREKYPHGRITTEEVCVDLDRGYARFKATIEDGEGGLATGYGTETKAGFADYCERSETRALGRALAVMGFGTQFVGADLSEGEHIADAPVTSTATAAPVIPHETTGISQPLHVGEGGMAGAPTMPETNGHKPAPEPDASLAHPTEAHLAALRNLAVTECQEPVEVYEDRLRRTMGIPKQASVAPKLLTRTMTMQAYMDVFAYYRRLEAQLAKRKEATRGTTPTTQPAAEPAPAPAEEHTTAVPSPATASSPAASDPTDAAERDRQRLRVEVSAWDLRVPPEEVEHVIQHYPYSKARALLWKCRRTGPAVTPIEAAAD